jgi:hypothetical protein
MIVEVSLGENRNGLPEIYFKIKGLAALCDRFLIAPRGAKDFRFRGQNARVERISRIASGKRPISARCRAYQ